MENRNDLLIKRNDYMKIASMLGMAPSAVQEFLQGELDRATVVEDEQLPEKVVAMNSVVVYRDLATNKENKVTLVYPTDANIDENKISVLAPVGSALIGLRVGAKIKWPLPNGSEKEIEVLDVHDEMVEAAGS